MTEDNLQLNFKDLQASIRNWLDVRQRMMIAFNQICMLRPFSELSERETQTSIEYFCTEVIDYLSFGQFKVFENLTKVVPSQSKDNRTIKILLSKIFTSTIQSIEFHDKYIKSFDLATLDADLSKLGEQLAARLDWEDQLLDVTYEHLDAHRPPIGKKSSSS